MFAKLALDSILCRVVSHRAAAFVAAVLLGRNVVLGKEVRMVRHRLELEVVSRRVLEEHGVLFPRLALESKVGLDDEFDPVRPQPVRQVFELLHRLERQARVWDGNLVAIDRIVVVDAPVVVPGPVTDDLVTVQRIVLPFAGGPSLLASEHRPVESLGFLERMDGKGVVEGIPGGRGAAGLVLCCGFGAAVAVVHDSAVTVASCGVAVSQKGRRKEPSCCC
mmetsp:Transcript_1364/g.3390  ORF Transcript_1364/g.3390 Transcript_1364/m.3390 type:complete len:221 (-) Transcript_1364:220-882(-)